MSVNISRYDVFQDDLIQILTGLIETYHVPVHLLRLEITESAFSKSERQIIDTVRQLITLGFTVEIDDFGSGYSSLNTLKDVPAQILKLDMQFLEATDESQRGGNILESVVRMAKWLDMCVIAEGVETRQQADFLKSIGCFFVQGYLYAKPMPLADYEALAAASQKQCETTVLETVENLDNNAFWSPESMDTLIFNNYLGGACILEYDNGKIELLRANDKYIRVIGSAGMTLETALKLDWAAYMDEPSREAMAKLLEEAAGNGEERTSEFVFLNLPGCAEKTYLRLSMRVIAKVSQVYLIYCSNENITAQRIAEQTRQETTEQLSFLEGVAHQLLTQSDVNDGILALLGKMLGFFDGDRCSVFEFDFEHGLANNTYECCGTGVASGQERFQKIPLEKMSYWLHAFDEQNYLTIEDVDALASDHPQRAPLQAEGVRSLVAVPLKKNGGTTGYIGVVNPKQKQEQIASLSALGDYAVVMLTRRDMDLAINRENTEKLAIMDGIPGGFVRMQMLPDGTIVPLYRSAGFRRLVHMSAEEISAQYGESVMIGVHPDDIGGS